MFTLSAIAPLIRDIDKIVGNTSVVGVDNAMPLDDANESSIVWVKNYDTFAIEQIKLTRAKTIICMEGTELSEQLLREKCFILTNNPKYLFSIIVARLFQKDEPSYHHSTAVIDTNAIIGVNVTIGAYAVVSNCVIGQNSKIGPHCVIYDNVKIGENVKICASSVIGGEGFGYSKNESGCLTKFPHIGGVLIEDDVEIGSNCSIDRGALGDTIIRRGTKIDNLVHIAHNVVVGEDSLIIANSVLGGSCVIGSGSWIAPSACIKNQITVGNDVVVGMGAVVNKNIPNGETWIGNPAISIDEYKKRRQK